MKIESRRQLPEFIRFLGLPMVAAEIGVAEGRFSLELLQAGISHLYLVDRWKSEPTQKGDGGFPQDWHDSNLNNCKTNLLSFKDCITFLQGDSSTNAGNVESNTLGMVYIDGDHSYEGVKKDLNAWYPKVVPGGIIAMHDYLNVADYGVKKAAEEFCLINGYTIQDLIIIPETNIMDAGAYFIKH